MVFDVMFGWFSCDVWLVLMGLLGGFDSGGSNEWGCPTLR